MPTYNKLYNNSIRILNLDFVHCIGPPLLWHYMTTASFCRKLITATFRDPDECTITKLSHL